MSGFVLTRTTGLVRGRLRLSPFRSRRHGGESLTNARDDGVATTFWRLVLTHMIDPLDRPPPPLHGYNPPKSSPALHAEAPIPYP